MSQNRRLSYTVDPRVRSFYVITWVLALGLLATFGALVWAIREGTPFLTRAIPIPQFLGVNVLVWIGILAGLLVGGALLLAVYATLQTHRCLGAAYRIHQTLVEMKEGKEPSLIQLRPGDYLAEIAIDLNEIIGSR